MEQHTNGHEIYFEQLPLTLKVSDIMRILSVSHNVAYELVRSGQIRSVRVGRCYRIPRDAVAAFLLNSK